MNGAEPTAILADIAELNPPLAASLSDGDEVSFMPMAAVDADSATAVDRETRSYSEVGKGYTPFVDGDVLVAKITPCFENGKIAQARLSCRYGFGSTEFHVVRPRDDRADARYLVHFLRQERIRKEGESRMTGTAGQRRVPEHFLAGLTIPLPPLPEQRRIAEILDKADALRAQRRAALAQLDTLTQSIFLDMFGDPATNPKGWPVMTFGELGDNEDSLRVPVKASDRDGRKGEFAYYGASGIIDWVDDFIFDGQRLLIGEDGANLVARSTPVAFVACGKYWVNNHSHVIAETDRADLRFLEFFVERIDLKPYLSGTAQPKLNRGNLDRIPVPTPPLQLQREFARRLGAVDSLKTRQQQALPVVDALFATLQHDAFSGGLASDTGRTSPAQRQEPPWKKS